ncbi:oxidoreductase molybdopterin binding protein [Thermocrinis albus DSM 14484]|uniref:Oxidoreductase molybdopterin binding protein n=1 Tax=Thermocrinis albus (strain DSM 14484 / JCM 11386 / HI 11/12) TaxID=638303 RepID=D3SL25_THEAH|nr:molybdopterin-dependent oxidoreductase [Thermocrinis albus]ADC89455.1 oxidoreductase molybdopterin binding protein [Thermocrinis albus DSM 14484]
MDRRSFLKGGLLVTTGGLLLSRSAFSQDILEIVTGTTQALKSPRYPLIVRTSRPRNYETPVYVFEQFYTPNDAFFVRWHQPGYAERKEDFKDYTLKIKGPAAKKQASLTLDELKKNFRTYELTALCQCSGNRRGLFVPRVPGVEWRYGAMGNARWVGVRLKDLLDYVGVDPKAKGIVVYSTYNPPVVEGQPRFEKPLPLWKAMDENVLLAFLMNGEEMHPENGYPLRLVVPGWTATYWIKAITDIDVVYDFPPNFWYNTAYRIPKGKFPQVESWDMDPSAPNMPITEIMVNSLVVKFVNENTKKTLYPYELDNTQIKDIRNFAKPGNYITVMGIAYDGGYGIKTVEVSVDGGRTWREARITKSDGRFSWVHWEHTFKVEKRGVYTVMAKATNRVGQTQTFELIWNPAGYHHNVVQSFNLYV